MNVNDVYESVCIGTSWLTGVGGRRSTRICICFCVFVFVRACVPEHLGQLEQVVGAVVDD